LKIVVMARQKARGKSEEGLGDFTFLYTVWFYCVHLLRSSVWTKITHPRLLAFNICKIAIICYAVWLSYWVGCVRQRKSVFYQIIGS